MLLLVSRLLVQSLWCFFWSLLRSVLMMNSFVKRYWILNFIVIFACNERKIKMECCIRGVSLIRAFFFLRNMYNERDMTAGSNYPCDLLLKASDILLAFLCYILLGYTSWLLYFLAVFYFFNYYVVDCSFLYYNRLFQISRLLITPALSLLSLVMEELVLYYSYLLICFWYYMNFYFFVFM